MTVDPLLLRKVCNSLGTDLAQIRALVQDYARFVERYGASMDVYLYRATASFMADFYVGVESVFTTIADDLDGGAPRGRNWHKRLIQSMAVERPGVRPAVISPEERDALLPFLVFRHVIPQAYGISLDQQKVIALERGFLPAQQRFSAELDTFCDYLRCGGSH